MREIKQFAQVSELHDHTVKEDLNSVVPDSKWLLNCTKYSEELRPTIDQEV